jgi:hypothetical protein
MEIVTMKHDWVITGLVAVVAVLATVIAGEALSSREAHAQVSGATADYLVGITGPERSARVPLFLIDSKKQTIMVYEYDQSIREFWLRAVRSFQYDRHLEDQGFSEDYTQNSGPSVRTVRRMVSGQ